jgi:PAS domain S-box-containing protein
MINRLKTTFAWVGVVLPMALLVFAVWRAEMLQAKVNENDARWRTYRDIVNASGIAFVVVDMHGTITEWNGGATKLLGYAPYEAEGRNIDFIIPQPIREKHRMAFDQAADMADEGADNKIFVVKCTAIRSNDEEIPVTVSVRRAKRWQFGRPCFLAIITKGRPVAIEAPELEDAK